MKKKAKQRFSTFDIVKGLSIKRERLREWMQHRFVAPTLPAEGVGTKALFSVLDLYKIAVFKRLIESGMSRRKAAALVDSNTSLNNKAEIEALDYLVVLHADKGLVCTSYMGPPPLHIERDLSGDNNWDIGIVINFKKIRHEIKKAMRVD